MAEEVKLLRGVRLQRIEIWDTRTAFQKQVVIADDANNLLLPDDNYRFTLRLRDGKKAFQDSIIFKTTEAPHIAISDAQVSFSVSTDTLRRFFLADPYRRLHVELQWTDTRDCTSGVYLWLIRVNQPLS